MPYSFTMAAWADARTAGYVCCDAGAPQTSPLKGKECAETPVGDARSAAENLFSPPRLEIKRETLTNCLGRMTAGAVGAGV
jgi:hypothetical protein